MNCSLMQKIDTGKILCLLFNNNIYFSIIDKSFMYKTDLPYDRNIFKVHSVSKVYHILSN